ncbi:ferredoxin-type protein NapF [Piscinibacter sp.]|uniref:ferredoxin-type protein NapF n=1 Tax=Piscinibacter sp. TaxID=1903157 RepID=UPI0039E60959
MDPRRRSFLRGRIADTEAPRAAERPRPPWSLRPGDAFRAACTRCGDCLRACPRGVLHAGDGGYPEIRFDSAGCSLCGECAAVCQSHAIDRERVAQAFAWRVEVGAACLNRRGVECRVCGDACEARALRFAPALGGIAQLRVDAQACTGCGDCVGVCPVGAIGLR